VRPYFESNDTAAVAFWLVFFGWGLIEWAWMGRERRAARRRGEHRSAADKGTAALFFFAIYGGGALAFAAAYNARWAAIGGPRPLVFGIGLVLIVVGVVMRQWAIRTLGRFHTAQVRILDDHALVTAGPYRVVRHPSYAAGLVADVGLGLALGNWLSLVVFVGLLAAVMVRRIHVEEEALREGLGEGVYDSFAAGRARLLPGVW
jgi:protein-S-isoprenylcysteine O-methyltransferase